MYKYHPVFEDPKDDKLKLWRYMDLSKYFSLLDSSCLYFCCASEFRSSEHQLNDPFEGSFPKIEYEYWIKEYGEKNVHDIYNTSSKIIYVNCWHLSEHESIAMWKLYSESNKGIAIKTSIANFKNSFEKTIEDIYAGKVQYIDYEKEPYYNNGKHQYQFGNLMVPYIHKRNIFEYEEEYRAIYSGKVPQDQKGYAIKVDLTKLIEEVILAPYFPNWLYGFINKITNNYLSNVKIKKSIFESRPYI